MRLFKIRKSTIKILIIRGLRSVDSPTAVSTKAWINFISLFRVISFSPKFSLFHSLYFTFFRFFLLVFISKVLWWFYFCSIAFFFLPEPAWRFRYFWFIFLLSILVFRSLVLALSLLAIFRSILFLSGLSIAPSSFHSLSYSGFLLTVIF